MPVYWKSNVEARLAALYRALGKAFDGDPYLAFVVIDETTIGRPSHFGWTCSRQEQAFKDNALAAKAAFTNTPVFQMINFACFDLSAFAAWLAQNKIGISGPDVRPGLKELRGVYPLSLKYHRAIPIQIEVQGPDYTKFNPDIGGANTVQELLDFAIRNINPHYMCHSNNAPFFDDEVVPAVRKFYKNGRSFGLPN